MLATLMMVCVRSESFDKQDRGSKASVCLFLEPKALFHGQVDWIPSLVGGSRLCNHIDITRKPQPCLSRLNGVGGVLHIILSRKVGSLQQWPMLPASFRFLSNRLVLSVTSGVTTVTT